MEAGLNKLGGVGLKNLVVIAMFTMLFIVGTKVLFTRYQVKGVSEVVHTV